MTRLDRALVRATEVLDALDAASGVGLDLLFAMSGIEPEIAASARQIEVLPDTSMPVATVGSLIVTKLLARDDRRRPMDADDLADRRVFALSPDEWDQLSAILDRPARHKPRLAALLGEPSVLERHSRRPAAGCGKSNSN